MLAIRLNVVFPIGLLAAILAVGSCRARIEVAADKVLKQIDSLLGEVDVKRKEVEIAVRRLNESASSLAKSKIEATVKAEQFAKQLQAIDSKIQDADSSLRKLREYLSREQSVEISGTAYTPKQLTNMAERAVVARKALTEQREAIHLSHSALNRAATMLGKRHADAKQRLAELSRQLEEIDAKMTALTSLRDASRIAGSADETIATNFALVELQVKTLSAKVETELRVEDASNAANDSADEIPSIDAIINATTGSERVLAEINKLLPE